MKKKLFLRLCLLMTVVLSFNSCRQDLLPEKETYNNSGTFQLTSKRISLNESKHKAKLLPELKKAEVGIKAFAKNNAQGKLVNYANGVSIDTESVIYIENGPNFHTYTFNITRENAPADAPLENLLLTPLADGTYKEFLVTYHLTPQEKENISKGYYFYSGTGTTISELAAGTFNGSGQLAKSSCGWTSETFWISCSSGKHDGSNFQSCEYITPGSNGTPPSAFTISTYTCADVKPNTIEQTPAPIGGGGSVGEGDCPDCPSNTTPVQCVQVPTDPTQPSSGMVDGNGCAIGLPTLPNVPIEEPKTDCERLKEKTDDPAIKHKMDSIKKRVTIDHDVHETSVIVEKFKGKISYSITQSPPNYQADGTMRSVNTIGSYDIAGMHNHPSGLPIFSYPDMVSFYIHYKFLEPFRKNEFSMFLFNYNGTSYALRMQDLTALDTLFAGLDLNTDAGIALAEKTVKEIYETVGNINTNQSYTADMAEKMLMKVLNSKYFGNGNSVFLYQYIGSQWKKLILNPDGTIQKIPCPQP